MQNAHAQSLDPVEPIAAPYIVTIEQQEHLLSLMWSDGCHCRYHYLWLRDNCPSAFHPITKERNFELINISVDIHPQSVSIEPDVLIIKWSEDDHTSRFDQQWLRHHSYSGDLKKNHVSHYQSWDSHFIDDIPKGLQAYIMTDDKALYDWMSALDKYGITLVRGMPHTVEAVVETASRIDYLRQTNFGTTFDVKSVANPINLAYTSAAIPLHTDLANQEVPPGYQFLHCLSNESVGGESTFTDGLKVLEDMRDQAPEHFRLLADNAIPFRFHTDEHDIRQHHPVINLDHFGNIIELKFNAHLADIFDLPEEIMHAYYLAYHDLMTRLRAPKYSIELKLAAGDMVVFDNRRVLHGRKAFDESNGQRHLRGCYVDRSEFKSRLRILQRKFNA